MKRALSVLALTLAAMIGLAGFVAVSPDLHRLLGHDHCDRFPAADAGESHDETDHDHGGLVSLLENGVLNAGAAPMIAPEDWRADLVLEVLWPEGRLAPPVLPSRPGRGPPVLS